MRSSLGIPSILKRSLQAFKAGDALAVSDFFDQNGQPSTQLDPKLAGRLGLASIKGPILANGALRIMQVYAVEFETFDVMHCEALSSLKEGRDLAAVVEWQIKQGDTAREFYGRYHNI